MKFVKKSFTIIIIMLIVLVSGCIQEKSIYSTKETATQTEKEIITRSVCSPDWSCNEWNECSKEGKQTRTCTDKNSCGVSSGKPTETQNCEYIVYNPEYINSFKIEEGSGILIPYFALEDKNGTNTLGEGNASIQIKNADGKLVFTQYLNFKPSDFIVSTIQNNLKIIYRWNINSTDIQKGISSKGTADLTITLSNGKIIKDTYSGFSIPSYTHEELGQMWEDEYNKNAKISREVISKGNFEVTLVKYGFYTHFLSHFADDKVTEFRADVKIKNVGSVKNKFYNINAKVTSDTKEYKLSFASQLSALDYYIESGFLKEKSLMFSGVPQNLTGQIKILAGLGVDETGENSYEFTVTI